MVTDATDTSWSCPSLDTIYYLEYGGTTTLRRILDSLGDVDAPASEAELDEMLFAYGAWEDRDAMEEALASRGYDEATGLVGFRLVR